MRLITFTNYYLSDIQKGIQSLHVLGEMIPKYMDSSESNNWYKKTLAQIVIDWSHHHKTVIVKKGGNAADIEAIFFELRCFDFPVALFREDTASLNGAATATGIIVPSYIWAWADYVRNNRIETLEDLTSGEEIKVIELPADSGIWTTHVASELDERDFRLIQLLNKYPLA